MAKVSVLLGRVVHDFMQISYFFVGFNFHCLGQEWLDFFFEFPYFLSDIPSAYIFWNFSNMNIFVENLSTLHVPSSLMNSKFSTGSITVGEEWGWLYQNQDKLVLNHPSNDEHKARKPKIKKKCILNSWVKTTSCEEKLNITSSTAKILRDASKNRETSSVC